MEKGKFNRAAFDPTQLQKFVDEVIEGGAGGGGGFEVPSFTAATFEVDLPDAEIHLSAEDCADIIKNKYPLLNVVASINEEDSVVLTFVCNNIFNSTEHEKPFSSLQYIMLIDDDEEVYEIGLNFAQDETINKSWAIKLTGEGGGSGTDKYLSDAELVASEVPVVDEKEVLFSSLDTANANFSLLPNNRSFWTTYDDYMKAIEGTKLEEITLVAGTAGNVRFYGYDAAIPYNQITNNLALAAQTADNSGYLLMTINVEEGTHTYLLDGTDSRVTISNQAGIDSCPPCLGISRTGDTGLLKYNSANITGEPYRHWTHAGLSGSTIETPDPTNALPILFKVSTTTSETKTELVLTMNDGVEHKVNMGSVDVGSTIESVYKGKTLSILGDSISTFSGQIPTGNATYYPRGDVSDVSNTWWKKLADALGMTILVNNSWSGSWVTTLSGDASAGCMTRCQSLHSGNVDPDVIIVWMGINDFNNEAALGTYDGKSAIPSDTTKFREAYGIMLNKILTRYKTSEVWVCTLPQMERNNDAGFPEINENGVSLKDFNDAIVELADAFGVKILDHNKAGMTYQNMDTYTVDWDSSTSKGLHPNDAGHSLIANNDIRQMDNAVRKRY